MLTRTPPAADSTPLTFSANNANGTGADFTVNLVAAVPTAFDSWASEWFSSAEMIDSGVSRSVPFPVFGDGRTARFFRVRVSLP